MNCPPCNHNCNQGRDCPAAPKVESLLHHALLALERHRQLTRPIFDSDMVINEIRRFFGCPVDEKIDVNTEIKLDADPRVQPWRVKIMRCTDPNMWYAKKVGQFVEIQRVDFEGLWAREDDGKGPLNIIRFDDV